MRQQLILDYGITDLNTYINTERGNRYVAAKLKKQETTAVYYQCKEQDLTTFKKPVKLNFHWYMKNSRKDPDNIAFAKKFVLDGMVQAGVLINDNIKYVKGFTDEFIVDTKQKLIVDIIEV